MLRDNITTTYPAKTSVTVSGSAQTVDSFSKLLATACHWDYVAQNGDNMRTGYVHANWNSSDEVAKSERATNDLNDTSDLAFAVVISGGNVILQSTTSNSWTITFTRKLL